MPAVGRGGLGFGRRLITGGGPPSPVGGHGVTLWLAARSTKEPVTALLTLSSRS